MAKADITIKTHHTDGEIHSVEFFFVRGGVIIHRHVLTENESAAELWKKHRKFWNKWYTWQETVILLPELKSLFIGFFLHPVRYLKCIRKLKK